MNKTQFYDQEVPGKGLKDPFIENKKTVFDTLREHKGLIATGWIAGSLLVAGTKYAAHENTPSESTQRVARCVSKMVGETVEFEDATYAYGGTQYTRKYIAEQMACERNDNDPSLAKNDIRPVPLASPDGAETQLISANTN